MYLDLNVSPVRPMYVNASSLVFKVASIIFGHIICLVGKETVKDVVGTYEFQIIASTSS